MQKIIHLIIVVVFFPLISGCSSSWKVTRETCKNRYYSFTPPPKWMLFKQGLSVLLSCHGTTLERISITRRDIITPLPNTLLKVTPEMLPHELGEVIVSRAMATPGVSNVVLRELCPAVVDGVPGVKCTFDYQINDLKFTDIVYSIVDILYLFEIRFSATRRYYYDESIDAFESIVKSFRLRR
ncbi:MAG TPA: hypothetical protein VHO70_15855 [Chitinispirillaceae bacterium]|nr:hypothetical protein [Chitinispirillaceae bacterium]